LPSAFLLAFMGVLPITGAGLPCVASTPRRHCYPTTCSGSGFWFAGIGGWRYSDACNRPRPSGGVNWCALERAPAVDGGGTCEYANKISMYEADGRSGLGGGCGGHSLRRERRCGERLDGRNRPSIGSSPLRSEEGGVCGGGSMSKAWLLER
jgi:hypothetical protein